MIIGKTIALVDDDLEQLEITREAFEHAGIKNYELYPTEKDFFEHFDDDTVVAVVDHVINGEVRGFSIVREIARRNVGRLPLLKCRIIVVSEQKKAEVIQEHLNSGHVIAYFGKGEQAFMDKLIALVKRTMEVVDDALVLLDQIHYSITEIQKLAPSKEAKTNAGQIHPR